MYLAVIVVAGLARPDLVAALGDPAPPDDAPAGHDVAEAQLPR